MSWSYERTLALDSSRSPRVNGLSRQRELSARLDEVEQQLLRAATEIATARREKALAVQRWRDEVELRTATEVERRRMDDLVHKATSRLELVQLQLESIVPPADERKPAKFELLDMVEQLEELVRRAAARASEEAKVNAVVRAEACERTRTTTLLENEAGRLELMLAENEAQRAEALAAAELREASLRTSLKAAVVGAKGARDTVAACRLAAAAWVDAVLEEVRRHVGYVSTGLAASVDRLCPAILVHDVGQGGA